MSVHQQPSLAEALRRYAVRRRVFVSYHHDLDQAYYDHFAQVFCGSYELASDRSLDRRIGSEDTDYVMRRIRENYLRGASVTVVLCGLQTPWRKYVDWEICASLNQEMALVGINLPTNPVRGNSVTVPNRLHDNVESGYAVWGEWNSIIGDPVTLKLWIESAASRSKSLIRNERATRQRNG